MRLSGSTIFVFVAIVGTSLLAFLWEEPVSLYTELAHDHPHVSGLLYVGWVFVTTVLAPMATAPVIPIASAMLGPVIIGVLSVVGWTAGGVAAFLIARRYGKPLVARAVRLDAVEYYEKRISPHTEFVTLVFLRMVIPVDVLSYAVGLVSNISLPRYTLATLIGVTPFSFLLAFGGAALLEGQYQFFVIVFGIGLVLFTLVWQVLKRTRLSGDDSLE